MSKLAEEMDKLYPYQNAVAKRCGCSLQSLELGESNKRHTDGSQVVVVNEKGLKPGPDGQTKCHQIEFHAKSNGIPKASLPPAHPLLPFTHTHTPRVSRVQTLPVHASPDSQIELVQSMIDKLTSISEGTADQAPRAALLSLPPTPAVHA